MSNLTALRLGDKVKIVKVSHKLYDDHGEGWVPEITASVGLIGEVISMGRASAGIHTSNPYTNWTHPREALRLLRRKKK